MVKIWRIIKYEYTRHVFQKRFIFSLLSLPFAVVAMVVVALLVGMFMTDDTPVGYIDQSGVLDQPIVMEDEGTIFEPQIQFLPYERKEQAQTDLETEEIQAYFVIPENYPESLDIQLVYRDGPDNSVQNQFIQFLRQNLDSFEQMDTQIRARLEEGGLITMISLDGSREMREDQWYLMFTPFVAGIMFIIVVMTSGGYLLQAVVEEKENRTMEIVITSVTPGQLMTGKIIGNIAIGLTQLIVWLLFGWLGVTIGGQFWPLLQDFSISTDYLIIMLLVMLPSFVMIAALMAAIGATMTETREAQQVSGMFSLPIMIPYYLSTVIMMNPNSTLAIILSYFPLTAPITILMRLAFTVIPTWQIVLNIAMLFLFALFAIWFAGRAFRIGMLQYGKKLPLKEIFRKQETL